VLNPTYYGWQDDLKQCREEFGMFVLRMTPDYHGYRLSDACAAEMAAAAHEMKMCVALYDRIVDQRGRHRLDSGRKADHDEIVALLGKFPKAVFLMLNFAGVVATGRSKLPACYYDIVRFVGRNGLRMEREIKQHGAERFIFGTTMLMRYAKPSCLALEKCRITRREREAIEWRNLARLLPG
jgi:hypothetical protein